MIAAIAVTEHKPTYEDTKELTQALKDLHVRQILRIDYDRADEEGLNDIDISRMNDSSRNDDYTIGGSLALQEMFYASRSMGTFLGTR